MKTNRLVVGISGASGAIYAVRFLSEAIKHFNEISVIVSQTALDVASHELERDINRSNVHFALLQTEYPQLKFLNPDSFFESPASGSYRHDGMVIVPCSVGMLGRIASGTADDLTARAADVCLKERIKLILVVRETPLNLIHLRNMTSVTEAGAVVLPAIPSFYHKPKTLEEAVDTVVTRIFNHLEVALNSKEWGAT